MRWTSLLWTQKLEKGKSQEDQREDSWISQCQKRWRNKFNGNISWKMFLDLANVMEYVLAEQDIKMRNFCQIWHSGSQQNKKYEW